MFTLKFILRNLFRHKLRNSLTLLGVTIVILAFGALRTVVDAWYAGAEAASPNRLVCRNAVSIIFPLPLAYRDRIRQVADVRQVSHGAWFGGAYIDERNFFPNFAVDAKTYFEVYREFVAPPAQMTEFQRDRRGCVIGRKLAARFGWKLGDTITLKGLIYPGDWPMVIRAVYAGARPGVDETNLFFHWEYLNETLKKSGSADADKTGFYLIEIGDPARAGEVSRAIDQLFANSTAETLTETEQAFQLSFVSMSQAIIMAIQIVSFVVIVIILAVAANTMAMTARERMPEYAVLKTLGFGGGYAAILIMGESLTLSALGGVFGAVLDYPMAEVFRRSLEQYFPVFTVSRETLAMQLAIGVAVGVAAGVIPAWRASRVRVVEGLRRLG